MAANNLVFAQIAEKARQQPPLELPAKHEWIELLTSLSHLDDKGLREIGISELQSCAENEYESRVR